MYKDLLEYFLDNNNNPSKKSEHSSTKEIILKNIDNHHISTSQKWIDRINSNYYIVFPMMDLMDYLTGLQNSMKFVKINIGRLHKMCDWD